MSKRACVPRNQRYFNADQYWRANRAGFRFKHRGRPDAELRQLSDAEWQENINHGHVPPVCPICGEHHFQVREMAADE